MIQTLTFILQADGFYTAEFQADGKCHVQINKEPIANWPAPSEEPIDNLINE